MTRPVGSLNRPKIGEFHNRPQDITVAKVGDEWWIIPTEGRQREAIEHAEKTRRHYMKFDSMNEAINWLGYLRDWVP